MRNRYLLPVLAATGALMLAACGGSDGDDSSDTAGPVAEATTTTVELASATDAPATTSATAPITDPPVTDPPVTDPPPTDPPSTEPASAPDVNGVCLVGEWVVTGEQMNKFYDAIESTVDVPLAISVEGSAPLTLRADGTYLWEPEFLLTVDVSGITGTGLTTGDISGNWSATDGIVTTDSDINALEVSITVGGATIDGADMANGFLNRSPVNGVTYSCDGPTPVLDFMTGDPDVTVPVALMPA